MSSLQTVFEFFGQDYVGIGLLLIKLTILLAIVLAAHQICRRYPAAFRHAVLTMGLFAFPLLFAFHSFAPAWTIPGMVYLVPAETSLTAEDIKGEFLLPTDDDERCDIHSASATVETELQAPLQPHTLEHDSAIDCKITSLPTEKLDFNNGIPGSIIPRVDTLPVAEPGKVASDPFVVSTSNGKTTWSGLLTPRRIGMGIGIIWLLGVLFLLCRIAIAWIVVSRTVVRSQLLDVAENTKQVPSEISSLIQQISDAGIECRISESANQPPLGIGLIRKTILLPSICVQWTDSQWRSVLLHEYAHFRRHDCLTNLVARIQQALLWFHPLVWVHVSQIRAESENACDDAVIQSGVSNLEYADVLFHVASQTVSTSHTMVATVTMSDATPLESRIHSILSDQTIRHPVRSTSIAVAVLLLAAVVIPISTAQFLKGQSESTATAPESTKSPAEETSLSGATPTSEPTIDLRFIVTLSNGESFVGKTDEEFEVESSFGRSFLRANQIRLVKSVADEPGNFRIEGANGSTVFGKIKAEFLTFAKEDGTTVAVSLNELKSASMVGRSGLAAERIADGFAKNQVTYHIRAQKNYEPTKECPALVLLHGSDSNSKSLIEKIATDWPELANKYLLIGINGEQISSNGSTEQPAFNYTYIDFVGKSKYKGVAGSDRESPALVAEVIEEIRDYVPISTIFLGGPSNGAWLTYSMYMNYPRLIDGAFPIAGAMIVQCDPDAYTDDEVRAWQRDTPIAIVHPKDHKSISQIYSTDAHKTYLDSGFPMVRFLECESADDEIGGSNFLDAIKWLESMSVRETDSILQRVNELNNKNRPRDAVGLITRIDFSKLSNSAKARVIQTAENDQVSELAGEFEQKIKENKSNAWIEPFLKFRETFEFAPSAETAMKQFAALRKKHDEPANLLFEDARSLFQSDRNAAAYERYEEIEEKYYAAKRYRYAVKKLAERDSNLEKATKRKNE